MTLDQVITFFSELFPKLLLVGVASNFAYTLLNQTLKDIEDKKLKRRIVQHLDGDDKITDVSLKNVEDITKYCKTEKPDVNFQKYEDQITKLQNDLNLKNTICNEYIIQISDLKEDLEKSQEEYVDSMQKYEDQISQLKNHLHQRDINCIQHFKEISDLKEYLKKPHKKDADLIQMYEDRISGLTKDLHQRNINCNQHFKEISHLKEYLEKSHKEYADSIQMHKNRISELQQDLHQKNINCNQNIKTISNIYKYSKRIRQRISDLENDFQSIIENRNFNKFLLLVTLPYNNGRNLRRVRVDISLYTSKYSHPLTLVKQQYLKKNILEPTVVVLENSIVFIGGNIDVNNSNKVIRISSETKKKIQMDDMIEKRWQCAGIELNNGLYVTGGMNETEASLSSVEMYNLYSNTWILKSQMINKRQSHAAVAFDERIYVFGGFDENLEYVRYVEVYDPRTNLWKVISEQNESYEKFFCSKSTLAAVHKNNIYVYDNHNGKMDTRVKIFCTATESWSQLPSLPKQQKCHGLVSFQDDLIFFGEYSNYVNRCLTMDNDWHELKSIQKINQSSFALSSSTFTE